MGVYFTETIRRKIGMIIISTIFGVLFYSFLPSDSISYVEDYIIIFGIASGIIAYLFNEAPTWKGYSYFLKWHAIIMKIIPNKKMDEKIQEELSAIKISNKIILYEPSSNIILMRFFHEWYYWKGLSIVCLFFSITFYFLTKI